jgi:hypothetical protein
MEMSQGYFMCVSLKQTKMSFFFLYKIGKQEGRTGPSWGRELEPVRGGGCGERAWVGEYGGNIV